MKSTAKALLLALGAALFGSYATQAADPVKIGVAIAQTGPFAPAAIPTLNAYKLWVDQTNAAGGLDVGGVKRPIDFVVYDDQSDFTKEATIYEKLITDDKVDLLLSPYATPAHFAIVGVLERYKFPMVGSTAASSQLKKVKPGNIWFPTSAMPDQMGPEFVKMMKSLDLKSIAIATLQSPFPQEIESYVKAALKGTDIKLVASEQFAPDVRDLTSVVSAIKKAKPDAVLSLSFPQQSILYMKAAREQNLDAPLQLVLIGPTHEFFAKIFGANLNGIMTIGHWSPYQAKWPKATEKVEKDREALLAFYAIPAEHWVHLKTTNPIESTFATVRLRTKVTKGPGSRAAGLAMAYKLIEQAQTRWRSVNAPELVALVRAGVKFEKGVMVERTDDKDEEVAA